LTTWRCCAGRREHFSAWLDRRRHPLRQQEAAGRRHWLDRAYCRRIRSHRRARVLRLRNHRQCRGTRHGRVDEPRRLPGRHRLHLCLPGAVGRSADATGKPGTGCKTGTQGGSDYIGGRGMLRWEASDDFEILLTADYQNETAEPKADTITEIDPGAGFVWSGIPFGASGPPYDERFLPPNPFVTYATYSDPRSGLTFRPRPSTSPRAPRRGPTGASRTASIWR
jgi:hypothetical protein